VSNWPEPTRDETEPPRWGWVVALAALCAIGVLAIFGSDRLDTVRQSWRAPEIALRGRSEPAPPPAPQVSEDAASARPDLFTTDVDGSITRTVPFKDCLALIFDTGNAVGVQPLLVEESASRTIARLPLREGGVTITCSASNGTMTIEHGAAGEP
jgi:hypothetical protein